MSVRSIRPGQTAWSFTYKIDIHPQGSAGEMSTRQGVNKFIHANGSKLIKSYMFPSLSSQTPGSLDAFPIRSHGILHRYLYSCSLTRTERASRGPHKTLI
jgi:hypothetical protein